jgi:hypothetical protein
VVGHDHELVQQVFFLFAIVEQDLQQKPAHAIGLQVVPLLKRLSGNEEN